MIWFDLFPIFTWNLSESRRIDENWLDSRQKPSFKQITFGLKYINLSFHNNIFPKFKNWLHLLLIITLLKSEIWPCYSLWNTLAQKKLQKESFLGKLQDLPSPANSFLGWPLINLVKLLTFSLVSWLIRWVSVVRPRNSSNFRFKAGLFAYFQAILISPSLSILNFCLIFSPLTSQGLLYEI